MKCREAQNAILEADIGALRGEGPDPLALHILECPACRRMAEAILQGEEKLGASMAGLFPLPDLDALIDRAQGDLESGVLPLHPRRSPWSIWKVGMTLVPLAAAAALTALFLGRPPALPGPEYRVVTAEVGLDVEVPQGTNAAVLQTNNPNITVLWLF